ncbi:hypothetical protein JIY74_29390 [Vibrio harveyi]|nr:hypothetical protein [Vibrio harveyi]
MSSLATPKCRTLNLPQLSSNCLLKDGPSTIIEVTDVPWLKSFCDKGISSEISFLNSTHFEK